MGWLRRHWFDLLLAAALVLVCGLVGRWREAQFAGHGLRGTWRTGAEFDGEVFATTVDPWIDFSDEEDTIFKRGRFSVEWSGTIVLPRPGRYLFATDSDDASWVFLDGSDIVVDNSGAHAVQRREGFRFLKAGAHAIRVRYNQVGAGASVRLFWMPVRRGVLETIPPTLLFPDPPERADTRSARAVPPRDLPSVVFIGGCFLLCCALWGRRPVGAWLRRLAQERSARLDVALALLVAGGALALRLHDLSAAGQTWDEDVYYSSGRNFVQNALAGDLRAESWAWNNEHPGLAKWIYGVASLFADDFEPGRGAAALLGALTCLVVFLAGRDLVSRRVGFLGAALSALLPHIVAHHKIIGLETPSGLFYALGVWLFFKALQRRGNTLCYLGAGLAVGLSLATRLSNLSLVVLMVVLYLGAHWKQITTEWQFPVSLTLGLAPLAAGLSFVLVWPYLWENPLQHLGQMLSYWKPDIYLEHFLGERQEPPLYYLPLYFAVTLPAALLPCVLLGLGRSLVRRDLGHLVLLGWFVAPFIVMFSPMARDGVRYLYPGLFAACLLAAAGVDWLAQLLGRLVRRPGLALPTTAVAGAALGLYVLNAGLQVHPYYLDYYNEIVGGPARVAERRWFEIAWWGEGLKEATDFLARRAPQGARVKVIAHPTHVIWLRQDLKYAEDLEADYVLYNNVFSNPVNLPRHREAYVVRAAGAPLVWVYEKESGAPR